MYEYFNEINTLD